MLVWTQLGLLGPDAVPDRPGTSTDGLQPCFEWKFSGISAPKVSPCRIKAPSSLLCGLQGGGGDGIGPLHGALKP